MEVFINYLGKLPPETANLDKVIDACTENSL
jgi:hypothetical protein